MVSKSIPKNEKILKLFYPLAVLGFFVLAPSLIFGLYKWFGVNLSAFQGVLFFLPQYLFPYDGYFRGGPFIEGGHQSLHPLGLSGWVTSLIHWTIVFFVYFWFARKLSLGKSLLFFCFLGVSSLVFVYFLLAVLGWQFSLDGP